MRFLRFLPKNLSYLYIISSNSVYINFLIYYSFYNDISHKIILLKILKILTISWRSLRHYVEEISKKTKRVFPSCFDEHTIFLFRAYSSDVIFFPPFHREVLRLPYRSSGSLGSSIRLCFDVSSAHTRKKEIWTTTRRYHYGHPSFRRWSWRGIRSEHLSSSRCIPPVYWIRELCHGVCNNRAGETP